MPAPCEAIDETLNVPKLWQRSRPKILRVAHHTKRRIGHGSRAIVSERRYQRSSSNDVAWLRRTIASISLRERFSGRLIKHCNTIGSTGSSRSMFKDTVE